MKNKIWVAASLSVILLIAITSPTVFANTTNEFVTESSLETTTDKSNEGPSLDTSSSTEITSDLTGSSLNDSASITSNSSDSTDYDGTNPGIYVWEEKAPTIDAIDLTIYVGNGWSPKDSFISANNIDGSEVDFNDVTVTGTVDTNTPGTYKVVYTYLTTSKEITVTVLEDQFELNVKDITIYVNDPWTASDNFLSAKDRYGKVLELKDFKVTDNVDTSKPGKYKVTYKICFKRRNSFLLSLDSESDSRNIVCFYKDAYITVIDKKKGEPKTPTDKPKTPTDKPTVTTKTSISKVTNVKNLPKTGTEVNTSGLIIGIAFVSVAGVFFILRKKRNKE